MRKKNMYKNSFLIKVLKFLERFMWVLFVFLILCWAISISIHHDPVDIRIGISSLKNILSLGLTAIFARFLKKYIIMNRKTEE